MKKRDVEVVVISDVHLGTYGCHAAELLAYLKSVNPKMIVLNGDIIDIWQFSKSYWPEAHMQVIKYLIELMTQKVTIYYVTGNHDEMLRKFAGSNMGSLQIVNKVVLNLDGKRTWIFHGDVFDVTMQNSKWLAKLGGKGYDMLILLNRFVNHILEGMGKGKLSLSKQIKKSVKGAVKFINDFEQVAADIAISNGYDYVLCGHIHQPQIRQIKNAEGSVIYLNSGDWIENLSALEYCAAQWKLYRFHEDQERTIEVKRNKKRKKEEINTELFQNMLKELSLVEH